MIRKENFKHRLYLPPMGGGMEIIMADKEFQLEKSFEKLNELIEALEKPDISLENSFAMYQEGMKLLKACNDSIDKVEKELIILSGNGETNEL